MEYRGQGFKPFIQTEGRCLWSEEKDGLFFNWSCCAIRIAFSGSYLRAEIEAEEDFFPSESDDLPVLRVSVGEAVKLRPGRQWLTLCSFDESGEHTLRLEKLSEQLKGRNCLLALETDGELLPVPPAEEGLRLEFVGDSISCGFGVGMAPGQPTFTTETEDGFRAYPALVADALGARHHSVCVSGINLTLPMDKDFRMSLPFAPDTYLPLRAMEDLYPYADRPTEEAMGREEFTPWDFESFRPHAIVVNLGTNDAFRIAISGNAKAEEEHYILRYMEFFRTLRRLNGPDTHIVAALGPMNYFLFDSIGEAIRRYKAESGDGRVSAFKFTQADFRREGPGGLGHPSAATQAKMARELTEYLKAVLGV